MIQGMKSAARSVGCVFVTSALLVSFAGCAALGLGGGEKKPMSVDPSVPGARGEVSSKESDNGNTELRVNVEHLAQPQALDNQARTYVVWVQDSQNGERVQNVGALQVNDDLKGNLRAITPMKHFDVFLTPEPIANAASPSGERVLWTTVTRQ